MGRLKGSFLNELRKPFRKYGGKETRELVV